MHMYSNADVDKYLEEGRHGETEEARKEAYSEFEKAYAKAPGILLVAYLQGDYVGVSGLDGLDTTRVLGHHSVGVMWNIEDWTIPGIGFSSPFSPANTGREDRSPQV